MSAPKRSALWQRLAMAAGAFLLSAITAVTLAATRGSGNLVAYQSGFDLGQSVSMADPPEDLGYSAGQSRRRSHGRPIGTIDPRHVEKWRELHDTGAERRR